MINEKYLPLGTVVMLKEGKHRVMIVGFCTTDLDKKDKLFDYTACLYPEGIFTLDRLIAFNHNDIEKIYSIGYSDNEEKEFKKKLKEVTEKLVDENGNLNSSAQEIFK